MNKVLVSDCTVCETSFSRSRYDGSEEKLLCAACKTIQDPRPLATRAAGILSAAKKRGDIPRLSHREELNHDIKCVDCGSKAQCWDHRDYTKPLEVDAVCQKCNVARGPAYPYGGKLAMRLRNYR